MFETFVIQLLGLVAWIFLALSYWRKKVNDVLILHVIACLLFVVHYYFLDGMSGVYVVLFEAIRDFVYYKSNNDLKIFYGSIPIYILIAVFSFNGFMSLLPTAASMVDGFSLANNKTIVVVGGIVSYTIWVIYDLYIGSFAGAIAGSVLVISNILVLITSHMKRRKKERRAFKVSKN